jgi:hypothetical protein
MAQAVTNSTAVTPKMMTISVKIINAMTFGLFIRLDHDVAESFSSVLSGGPAGVGAAVVAMMTAVGDDDVVVLMPADGD